MYEPYVYVTCRHTLAGSGLTNDPYKDKQSFTCASLAFSDDHLSLSKGTRVSMLIFLVLQSTILIHVLHIFANCLLLEE